MATLKHNKPRGAKTLAEGLVKCNPESGRLDPVVDILLTEDIGLEIGTFRLWLNRAEFLTLADRMITIAKMIRSRGERT